MKEETELTDDQLNRIAATLRRIREGLARFETGAPGEPALIFKPEAFDDLQS